MTKIAIVDDHQSVLDGLRLCIEKREGLKLVYSASTGEQLLEYLKGHSPDIIVSDYKMPGMNGLDLCKKINTEHNIPVLIFSRYHDGSLRKDAEAAGAQGFVPKSSGLDDVCDEIEKVLGLVGQNNKMFKNLSTSESEILIQVSQGYSNKEIANLRNIAVGTVERHRKNILKKLGLKGRGALLRYALSQKQNK